MKIFSLALLALIACSSGDTAAPVADGAHLVGVYTLDRYYGDANLGGAQADLDLKADSTYTLTGNVVRAEYNAGRWTATPDGSYFVLYSRTGNPWNGSLANGHLALNPDFPIGQGGRAGLGFKKIR